MTLSYSLMYWFTRLDGLNTLFGVITFFAGVALLFLTIFSIIASYDKDDPDAPTYHKMFKKFINILIFPWIISLLGLLFVPSSKEMAMIYVVPNIADSQVIKQDIPEIYDLGVDALKDWLKDKKSK